MIRWTCSQWEEYCEDHPWLSAHECLVLYWLVHDHSAVEGRSRPGLARLERVTHADHKTITKALAAMVERGDIVLAKRWPKGSRKADEYEIPWLDNPVDNESDEREISRKRSRKRSRTSSPLRGDRARTPARRSGAAGVAPPADDATDCSAGRCAVCDDCVDGLTECPVSDWIADGVEFDRPCWINERPALTVVRS